jgi:hypothetical protein
LDKENDEALLRAYQASYAALQNITFNDFKIKASQKAGRTVKSSTTNVKETQKKVEQILNNNKWTEV